MKYWTTAGTFLGALLGLILAWIYGPVMVSVAWMGELFIGFLRFLVMPLIMSAMIVGVSGLGDVRKLGRFGGITLGYFLLTTCISVTIGIVLVTILKPGVGAGLPTGFVPTRITMMADYGFGDFILSFLGKGPNIFYSLVHMEMLPTIIFSLIFGALLTTMGEPGKPVISFFRVVYEAVPSMFTVAPTGSTKLADLSETLFFVITFRVVIGRVAALLAVDRAVKRASIMPRA